MQTPSALATLAAETERLGLTLDALTFESFGRYLELMREWTPRAGLTAITDPSEIQRRHFGESLALLTVLRETGALGAGAARVVDIGSGAGLPGLPMRVVEPSLALTLVESNGKRCDFLRQVVEELSLDGVQVVQKRAEDAGRDPALRGTFDLALARAVAPLPVVVEYALPLLRSGGLLATPRGSRASLDLEQAAPAIEALGGEADAPRPLPLPPDVPPQQVLLVRRTRELDDRYPRRTGIPAKRPLK